MPALGHTNVLLIILDDMGPEQFGAWNTRYDENFPWSRPNMDALKAAGVRANCFYVAPACSQTRAQLLTGRTQFRQGLGLSVSGDTINPLWDGEFTLFEAVRDATKNRYEVGVFGKWHLGCGTKDGGVRSVFDKGANFHSITKLNVPLVANVPDLPLTNPNNVLRYGLGQYNYEIIEQGVTKQVMGQYTLDWVTGNAARWIRQRGRRPWFAWVALNPPHEPHSRPPDGTYDNVAWPLATQAPVNGGGTLTPNTTEFVRPFYKASCESVDYYIGRLVASMPEDVRNDTAIIILSDNGTEEWIIGPNTGADASNTEKWISGDIIDRDRVKQSVYDTGIRTEAIFVPPPNANALFDWTAPTDARQLMSVQDIYPTIIEALSPGYMAHLARRGVQIDGIDQAPALRQSTKINRTSAITGQFRWRNASTSTLLNANRINNGDYQSGNVAVLYQIVTGGGAITYKLIRNTDAFAHTYEFYNVTDDPQEESDLLPTIASASDQDSDAYDACVLALAEHLDSIRVIAPPDV